MIPDFLKSKEYWEGAIRSNPFEIAWRLLRTHSGQVALRRSNHIWKIVMIVYIPLIALNLYLYTKINYLMLPLLLITLLSAFPFAKYILAPLSEKKYPEIKREVEAMNLPKYIFKEKDGTEKMYW